MWELLDCVQFQKICLLKCLTTVLKFSKWEFITATVLLTSQNLCTYLSYLGQTDAPTLENVLNSTGNMHKYCAEGQRVSEQL